MKHERRGSSVRIGFERDRNASNGGKEFVLALGRQLKSRLAGSLPEQRRSFACDREIQCWGEPVDADQSIEDRWRQCDGSTRLRRLVQRHQRFEQMQADVIHARECAAGCEGVRQYNHSDLRLRIVTDEGPVASRSAVLPDNLTTSCCEGLPAECRAE